MELSQRFINAYNTIDSALKEQNDMKRGLSYTEAIRKAAKTNAIVRKYEEDLVTYGRLRNAIVHSANENFIIAEPHKEVVEEYEKIAKLIAAPPLAYNTDVCKKQVHTISSNTVVKDVFELLYRSGHSNIPVYDDEMLVGVANGKKLASIIGKKIYEKVDIEDFFNNKTIGEVLKEATADNYYTIANEKVTLDVILNLFNENRKLLVVLITKGGSLLQPPIGIITQADILDINKVLDDYSTNIS